MLLLKTLANFSTTIHPSLNTILKQRGIHSLHPFQHETLSAFNEGSNVFVNSCTGSGKTLAYLLPIINHAYQKGQRQGQEVKRKGTLVLTLNKELVGQVYREALWLDVENRLTIQRTGSINQISSNTDQKLPSSQAGMVNHLNWSKFDLLISTPQTYTNYLTLFKGRPKPSLLPQFLIIDEADVLLQLDQNVSKHTHTILSHLRQHTKQPKLQCILAASSFPIKYRKQNAEEGLGKMFRPLKSIEGTNRHKLPEEIDLFYIDLVETEEQKMQMEKLHYLSRILSDRPDQRIIIFCYKKASIQLLMNELNEKMKIPTTCLHAQLKVEERDNNLKVFSKGEARVLICSELGGRGLDFQLPVDCVIQYDMAKNIVHFINRAGRTARNNLQGQVITFVQPQYKDYYEHLKAIQSQNDQLDELFSRKRSYSKLYKEQKPKEEWEE